MRLWFAAAAAGLAAGAAGFGIGHAQQDGDTIHIQPGQWESNWAIVSINGAAPPAGMPSQSMRYCVTPDEAEIALSSFLEGMNDDSTCRYDDVEVGNGRIGATVRCEEDGSSMETRMDGRYTATSYEMDMDGATTEYGETIRMHTRITSRHIGGECAE